MNLNHMAEKTEKKMFTIDGVKLDKPLLKNW